jgi:hypothetical protein
MWLAADKIKLTKHLFIELIQLRKKSKSSLHPHVNIDVKNLTYAKIVS